MSWRDLEERAPDIAGLGRERLERARVALLGTLRKDGSPRISPVEPFLTQGQLLFGSMTWSAKTRDIQRDPRCVLHSPVTDPDSGEGELKLYGAAVEASRGVREACAGAWWLEAPPEVACVFSLQIAQAAFVDWDLEGGEMSVRRWSAERGFRLSRRPYP